MMASVRMWLALAIMRFAVSLISVSRWLVPPEADVTPEGPSDYADPKPMTDEDTDFWVRHRITRHPGGVVTVASIPVSDDGECQDN